MDHAGGRGTDGPEVADRVATGYLAELVEASVVFPTGRNGEELRVLDRVSLGVERGRVTCLVGPSGCGKTTILNVLAGFVPLSAGHVRLALPRSRLKLGYVFQEYALFPWLTVRQNVAFGLRRLVRLSPEEARARVEEWLRVVGLEGFGDYYPYQLSGGMRQRVAVARALAYDPDLVLMDEPFGALDELTRQRLVGFLDRLLSERPFTAVYVTHNVREAAVLSDVVYVMSGNPGRILHTVEISLPRPRGLYGREVAALEAHLFGLVTGESWARELEGGGRA